MSRRGVMRGSRPNILLVMQDQLRCDVVHDAELCRTPVQDSLASQGASLHQHYTPLGICSPARAAMFTGVYPHTNGVLNNLNGTDAFVDHLPHTYPTIAELLRDVGYRTGYVGKWHLGASEEPGRYGFGSARAIDADLVEEDRFRNYWARFSEPGGDAVFTRYPDPVPGSPPELGRRPFPLYSPEVVPEDIMPARAVQEEGSALIRELAGDDPFFVVVSFVEPHWPNVLPEPYASMYDPADIEPWANFDDSFEGKPETLQAGLEHFGVTDFTWDDWAPIIARYLGAVGFIDDLVGRLLADLERVGLADDTVVVATADHGDMAGSHRQFNKGPLMYDEVYRIPCFVRHPDLGASGTRIAALTSHLDLMPTFLDLAGAPLPEPQHGASLLPLLREPTSGWRAGLMAEYHGDEFGLYSQRMLRRGNYKLIYNPNGKRELYDMEADPYELSTLAYVDEFIDMRRALESNLLALMHEFDDPLREWAVNALG
jgi:arylsulfatase A-like enzyme